MKTIVHHYASVASLLHASTQPLKLTANSARWDARKNSTMRGKFYGITGNIEDCRQVVVNGWDASLSRMEKLNEVLAARLPTAEGVKRKTVRADSRGRLDIHALNSGKLSTAWVSKQRQVSKAPLPVQILVDVCASYCVNADDLLWRGVAAMTLCRLLQKAGYLVGISAVFACNLNVDNSRARPPAMITVDVKPFKAPLDMTLLSSTVGFPGFFRSFGFFALIAAGDSARMRVNDSIGSYHNPSDLLEPSASTTQLLVPEKVNSEESARDWLSEVVRMLGGEQ